MLVTLWNGEEFSKLFLACVAGGTYLLFARDNFWRRVAKYECLWPAGQMFPSRKLSPKLRWLSRLIKLFMTENL